MVKVFFDTILVRVSDMVVFDTRSQRLSAETRATSEVEVGCLERELMATVPVELGFHDHPPG